MEWPGHLVGRIAEGAWALFLGSGVAATCTNGAGDHPPTWPALLRSLCDLIGSESLKETGLELIHRHEYLSAADHIRYSLAQEHKLNDYQSTLKAAVTGPPGDAYRPSPLYEALLSLEPEVVFTTNYDKVFETASSNGYASHSFESRTLGADLRRGDAVLVKLHGSTDSISEVVLTRTDFARVMKAGGDVYEMLRSFTLTSTLLFVGYSLDDPDIQLVMQAVGRGRLDPEAHFMLAPEPSTASRIPVFRESYGVTVLTYPAGEHDRVEEAIRELSGEVLALRASMGAAI